MELTTPTFPQNTVPGHTMPTPALARELFAAADRSINPLISELDKNGCKLVLEVSKDLVKDGYFGNTDTIEQSLEAVNYKSTVAMLPPEARIQVALSSILLLDTEEGRHFRSQVEKRLRDLGYENLSHVLYRVMVWQAAGYNKLLPDNRTTNDPGMHDLLMQYHTGLVENEASMKELFSLSYVLSQVEEILGWLRRTILLCNKAELTPLQTFAFLDTKLQESSHSLARDVAMFLGEYRTTARDLNNPPTLDGFMQQLNHQYRGMFIAWNKPGKGARISTSGGRESFEQLNAVIDAQQEESRTRRPVRSDKCAYCKRPGHFWVACDSLNRDKASGKLKAGWVDRA